jgi:hypothetical protein
MNIFVSSDDPVACAAYLDDKRVVKMTLETCQLLSTAVTERGGQAWYKPTHRNHPCSVWARETQGNYRWLLRHFEALLGQYHDRYGRDHKCSEYLSAAWDALYLMPLGGRSEFADCSQAEGGRDVHERYRECLRRKWEETDKRKPTWRTRGGRDAA